MSRVLLLLANLSGAAASLFFTSTAGATILAQSQSESATASTLTTKPYTLYAGRNFAIEWKGKLRPVVDVQGSFFVVEVDGHQESVSSRRKDLSIKIDDAIKVTPVNATIVNFKSERVYSPGNDPAKRMQESMNMSTVASQVNDSALADANLTQASAGLAMQNINPQVGWQVEAAAEAPARIAAANTAYLDTLPNLTADINSVGNAANSARIEASRELYDAFSLTFDVSSPQPLRKPYIVVITRFHEKPDRPDSLRQWVYAENLPRVDSIPLTVRVKRAGFTPGYTLDDVQVDLFDGATEVATNIAHKRVSLTSDEAFQFSVVEYVEQHRGATLPLSQISHHSSNELRSRLPADQLSRTAYVKVGKNGMPAGSYWDAECTQKISDPELAAFLASMRFEPALNNGKPVESVSPLHLDSL